jgi:cytochrome c oxidase cbb3-type subunit 2
MNPRSVVPKSNMPAFPWLFENTLNRELSPKKLRALQILGVPYTDEEINKASEDLINKTEADAVVAYLQQLGTVIKKR